MSITRRTLGLGLLGLSAAVTAGVVVSRSNPELLTGLGIGDGQRVNGAAGGEKEGLLRNPRLAEFLRREAGVRAEAVVAGGVEQCRRPSQMTGNPHFLWPGSDALADLARQNGAAIRSSTVVLRSPLVFHSWEAVAAALVTARLASVEGGVTYVDAAALISALAEARAWEDLGGGLSGPVRIKAADPYTSASGLQFAGLVASLLAGDVATAESVAAHRPRIVQMFERMGRKPANAKQLFEDYLAAGPGGAPLAVGYESQHLEWILADPARWSATPPERRPAILYPRPTILAAHAMLALTEYGDRLATGLARPEAQAIAWSEHGLRSGSGAVGANTHASVAARFPATLPALLPPPEAAVLIGLADAIRGRPAPPAAGPPPAYTDEPFSPYR